MAKLTLKRHTVGTIICYLFQSKIPTLQETLLIPNILWEVIECTSKNTSSTLILHLRITSMHVLIISCYLNKHKYRIQSLKSPSTCFSSSHNMHSSLQARWGYLSVYEEEVIFIFQQIYRQRNYIISLHSGMRILPPFRLLSGHLRYYPPPVVSVCESVVLMRGRSAGSSLCPQHSHSLGFTIFWVLHDILLCFRTQYMAQEDTIQC